MDFPERMKIAEEITIKMVNEHIPFTVHNVLTILEKNNLLKEVKK